jgi:hypothetical protein
MALTLNGSANTIAGVAVGGLPDGIVDAGTLASNSVETAKIAAEAVTAAKQGPGSVIQYIQAPASDTNNRHSESAGNWESTGNHVDITPTNSTNLIIVGGFVTAYSDANAVQSFAIHNGTSLDTLWDTGIENTDSGWYPVPFTWNQTAGTTNQLTFTLYHARIGGSGNSYMGFFSSPGSSANWANMWAMEVVA